MIQLEGTSACKMRDILRTQWLNKEISKLEITRRLEKITIPAFLRGEIIEMVRYREADRCTCPIEQAMFSAVCTHIVSELMDAEKSKP